MDSERKATIWSDGLEREMGIRVWVPPGYAGGGERRFPVVVCLDAEVFVPCGGGGAPEWVGILGGEGVMPRAVVVGVERVGGGESEFSLEGIGGDYARFVAEELVGWIDREYRTLAAPEARILAGAGLGALCALHIALTYPGSFRKTACLSTSFEDVSGSLPGDCGMLREIEDGGRLPEGGRIYFDYGTVALDECYEPYHAELGSLLRERGWRDGREFVIERVAGGSQTTGSWRERLGPALRWLGG
jgi:pimeloyl-ACP methyl ester carboxylesterase